MIITTYLAIIFICHQKCAIVVATNSQNIEIKNLMHKFLHKKSTNIKYMNATTSIAAAAASKRIILFYVLCFISNWKIITQTQEYK